jgi:hypothetical protein
VCLHVRLFDYHAAIGVGAPGGAATISGGTGTCVETRYARSLAGTVEPVTRTSRGWGVQWSMKVGRKYFITVDHNLLHQRVPPPHMVAARVRAHTQNGQLWRANELSLLSLHWIRNKVIDTKCTQDKARV